MTRLELGMVKKMCIMENVKRCHICGKPASIFLTQIANGKLSEMALCEECAKKKGIFDPGKLRLATQLFPSELSGEVESFIRNMIESTFAKDDEQPQPDAPDNMLSECPACHYTFSRYQENGYLGCPDCYLAFAPGLVNLIKNDELAKLAPRFDLNTEHADSPALERSRLEKLMQKAINEENYEEAAKLRDQIKTLQKL